MKITSKITSGITNEQQTNNKQITTTKEIKNIRNKEYKNNINGQNLTDNEPPDWEIKFQEFYKNYPKKVKKQDVQKYQLSLNVQYLLRLEQFLRKSRFIECQMADL